MLITSLELHSFRNYKDWTVKPSPTLTVLLGPNASGKTNAIEAAQLATTGTSFRRPRWEDLVCWGQQDASVRAAFEGESSTAVVELRIQANGHRTILVNGVSKRKMSDATGILPSVLFTPDDLDLVKGPAEMRRAAIDELGGQLSKTYGAVHRDYTRVVRHRNTLLREWQANSIDLEPWNTQMVSLGGRLLVHRVRLLKRMARRASEAYQELSGGEVLSAEYLDRCGLGDVGQDREVVAEEAERALLKTLKARAAEEQSRRMTLVGPHRDDIVFTIDGRNARTFASQGQQRTIALAWTLAKVAVVEEIARRKPLLLLDDVMSELDADRRRALTGLVQRDVQTIISTTNTEYFDSDLLRMSTVIPIPKV